MMTDRSDIFLDEKERLMGQAEVTKSLWQDVDKVSLLIEPVLLEQCNPSPLYDDVMRPGYAFS